MSISLESLPPALRAQAMRTMAKEDLIRNAAQREAARVLKEGADPITFPKYPCQKKKAEKFKSTLKTSTLEAKFISLWGDRTPFVREHRFHATRKWRFDFAFPSQKVAVEIEGGIWTNGAHTRGAHFQSDCEKYLAALCSGWIVARLTDKQITEKTIEELSQFIVTRK